MNKITPVIVNSSAFGITYTALTNSAYAAEFFFHSHVQMKLRSAIGQFLRFYMLNFILNNIHLREVVHTRSRQMQTNDESVYQPHIIQCLSME
jgi:hypothetical protein